MRPSLARPLPEGSFFALLAEHGDRIVRDEDFAACYSRADGAAVDPAVAVGEGDVVAAPHRRVGRGGDGGGRVGSALEDRARVGGRSRGLASDVVDEVPRAVVVARQGAGGAGEHAAAGRGDRAAGGPAEQIIDSTPMLGAAATQDTVRLVRHGVRKLLDAVAAVDEHAAGRLDRGLEFDYARPNEKPDCRWREKAERERMLTRVAQDAERALRGGRAGRRAARRRARSPTAHRLLRELIGQDFDIDDDGVPAAASRHARRVGSSRPSTPRCATAARASTSALTATSSRRRSRTRRQPLITAVEVAPASEQDGPQAKHLIDAQPDHAAARAGARATPPTAPGRSAPSSPSATSRCSRRWRRGMVKPGRLGKRDFEIDLDAGTVTCPAGQTATIRTEPDGRPAARLRQAPAAIAARCAIAASTGARDTPDPASRPTKSC